MAIAAVAGLPDKIEAGNTYNITESFSLYPTSAWTMQLVLSLNGKSKSVKTTVSGTSFAFTLPTDLAPGLYDYAEYVTETASGQRATAKQGVIEVLPNLSTSAGKSTAQTILESLETAIQKLSGGTNTTVSFNGQSFTKKDLKTLQESRTYWKSEVLREQSRANASRRGCRSGEGRATVAFTR
jgi:hypothetical protein